MAESSRNSQLLSAETLIQLGWHQDTSIPLKGSKEYAPDGSWIEAKRFDVILKERRDLLSEERVTKLAAVARCEWKPELGKCEVVKTTRKFWQTMGHTENGTSYLYPEEAMFLVDTGMLEIYYGGLPFTLRQAYSTFIGHHITLEQYQTYSLLTRYGFILRRHDPERIITEYERQLRIDQYTARPTKKRKLSQSNEDSYNLECVDFETMDVRHKPDTLSEGSAFLVHTSDLKEADDLNTDIRIENSEDSIGGIKDLGRCRYTKWDWNEIDIPCIADKNSITLCRPSPELLPCCVHYERDSYTIDLSNFKYTRKWDGEFELSLGGTSWKRSIEAGNWGEYRVKYQKYLKEYTLKSSPAGHLWKGNVKPLVKPIDAKTSGDILKKLQVIESAQVALPTCSLPNATNEELPRLTITYDVHLPNSRFKKSASMLPNHHICIVRSADPFPSLAEMTALSKRCQPKIPLHFAVVDCGDISFYVFHSVLLPMDKTLR